MMYPILLCSVIAVAILLERLWFFSRQRGGSQQLMMRLRELIDAGNRDAALQLCCEQEMALSRLLRSPLRQQGRSRVHLKTLLEEAGHREQIELERYLGLLGTIATITPLLGLLGTVFGMIRAFSVIAAQGGGTPATLGGGISEALITTAAGLAVAVPTILVHKFLTSRVDQILLELEEESTAFVDLLSGVD